MADEVERVALEAVLIEIFTQGAEPVGVAAAVVGLQGPGHVIGAACLPDRPGWSVGQSGLPFNRFELFKIIHKFRGKTRYS